MLINCFRGSNNQNRHSLSDDGTDNTAKPSRRPRPVSLATSSTIPNRAKFSSSRRIRRNGSSGSDNSNSSTSSWCSNESIARLPPCKRDSDSDSRIEAMMMPVPSEAQRQSRCLRLSHPKTYSAIVSDMKASKGTRDWRNFAVFYNDEIDENVSAVARAEQRARDCERRVKALEAMSLGRDGSSRLPSVDMIG